MGKPFIKLGCLKLQILEQDYKKPELKIVYSKKRLNSEKSNLEERKYYGARYYDPVLSNWLSVDPLASKRPGLSPYNFVQNNPLNRIDPDGLTDYKINKKGEISIIDGTQTTEGKDRLIKGKAVYNKKTGKLKGREGVKYQTVDKEVFNDLNSNIKRTTFTMTSGEKAEKLYDFIANYVGSEYGKSDLIFGNGDKVSYFITSYHVDKIEGVIKALETFKKFDPDLILVSNIHNHNNTGETNMVGSYSPSGKKGGKDGDIPVLEWLNKIFDGQDPMPEYYIWRNYDRRQYDENGTIKKKR